MELRARQDGDAVRLRLTSDRPVVLQGADGYSQKHPAGGGSHYYSQPFLAAAGELELDGKVIPVSGQAWLDREWSSQFLQPDQSGWDWFALHLDSGEKLMLYRLRSRNTPSGGTDYPYGVLLAADGEKTLLEPARIELEVLDHQRVAGRTLPLRWRIRLPQIERELEVAALHAEQWMDVDFAYWEGVVLVRGAGPGSTGRGYLELTGYPRD
jgi:predicted secreted hydrolase